jgi:hypothetical protein
MASPKKRKWTTIVQTTVCTFQPFTRVSANPAAVTKPSIMNKANRMRIITFICRHEKFLLNPSLGHLKPSKNRTTEIVWGSSCLLLPPENSERTAAVCGTMRSTAQHQPQRSKNPNVLHGMPLLWEFPRCGWLSAQPRSEREFPSPSPPRSGGEGRGEVVLRVPGAKLWNWSAIAFWPPTSDVFDTNLPACSDLHNVCRL